MNERGAQLTDRYQLGPVLGQGGMATVYRATDRLLGREVAVKVLHPRFASDERFVERFRREAQAAAGLSHPNVVAVYDTGADGDQHFIVTELIDGPSLAEELARRERVPLADALPIVEAMCAGLAAAHRRGLVHRDVKPGNVLRSPAGVVKVADFGIARAATDGDLTETGTVLGTASYLAPEQARGERADARSDVYAIGCVLYALLTGRPPFISDSAVAVAHQHATAEPPDPSELGVPLPAPVTAVLRRVLAKDPAARPADAAALGAELAAVRSSLPSGYAHPPQSTDARTQVLPAAAVPAARALRPGWLVGAGAVVLVLVALVLALLAVGDSPPDGLAGDARADEPAVTTAPAEATTTEPEPEPGPSVGAAAGEVFDVLDEAVRAGDLKRGDARKVADRVSDALKEHREGKSDQALEKLDDAYEEVDDLEEDGDVPHDQARLIRAALDGLAEALRAGE